MLEIVLQSSLLIAILIALRPLLKRWMSARALYALWLLPALRMLIPISLQSPLSLLNAVRPVVERAQDAVQSPAFRPTAIAAPVSAQGIADTVANAPPIADMNAPTVMTADTGMTVSEVLFWIWLAGAALLCTYMIIVNLGLHRRMLDQISFIGASRGLPVYLARDIASPCLMGVLRPKILLPEDIAQYAESNQCSGATVELAVPTCASFAGAQYVVDPGCVEYSGCAAPTLFCRHDDPNYFDNGNPTNHGWPCFANSQIFAFFESQR